MYTQSWRNLNSVVTRQIYQTHDFDENNELIKNLYHEFYHFKVNNIP